MPGAPKLAKRVTRDTAANGEELPVWAALEASSEAIVFTDAKRPGNPVLYVNPAFEKMTGYRSDEVIGDTCPLLAAADGDNPEVQSIVRAFEKKESVQALVQIKTKAGERRWVEISYTPVPDESGKIKNFIGILHDVTQRISAEEALKDSEAQLNSLFENSEAYICLKDREGRVLRANDNFFKIYGFRPKDALGKTAYEIHSREMADEITARDREAMRTGCAMKSEVKHLTASGQRDYIEVKFPIRDNAGNITGTGGIGIDLTEQNRAQEALRESEAQLKSLVDHANAFIVLKGTDGRILRVNRGFSQIYGIRAEDAVGTTVYDIHNRELADDITQRDRIVFETKDAHETELMVPKGAGEDGEFHYFHVIKFPIADEEGTIQGVGTMGFDISERRKAEEAVRLSEQRFRDFSESASDWFWENDADHRNTYISADCELFWGFSNEQGIGKTRWDLACGEPEGTTWEEHRKVLEARKPFRDLVFPVTRPDGQIRKVSSSGKPIFDSSGTFLGYRGVGRDVTEQKCAEARLQRAHKMEAMGHLTGGVAHDFNNLLTAIMGNLEQCDELGPEDHRELQEYLKTAMKAARRGSELTHRLLAFSRIQQLKPKSTNINALMEAARPLISRTIGEHISVEVTASAKHGYAIVDEGQLETALLNLAINARDAMPEGGTLNISTEEVVVDEIATRTQHDAKPGRYVRLTVSDTGTRMSKDVAKRALEPFFTTKDVGKGSGLGLSMVYGFVTQLDGWLEIDSTEGKGTSIKLYLPADDAAAPSKSADDAVEPTAHHAAIGQDILVVEDDRDVRTYVSMVLSKAGYRVYEAVDAPEALKILEAMEHVDLLFTDVILPSGITGVELAQTITSRFPKVKILMTSGYPRDAIDQHVKPAAEIPLLLKPFTKNVLMSEIQKVLQDEAVDPAR